MCKNGVVAGPQPSGKVHDGWFGTGCANGLNVVRLVNSLQERIVDRLNRTNDLHAWTIVQVKVANQTHGELNANRRQWVACTMRCRIEPLAFVSTTTSL
jgi:hypothetical protein